MEGTLYGQIEKWILTKIQNGTYKPGDMIPSQNELIGMFDVSKSTVNKALSELVYEGHLTRVQGKGTFVQKNNRLSRTKRGQIGFKEEMENRGKEVKTEPISIETIKDNELSGLFNISDNAQIIKYTRRRLIEDTVVAVQTSYVPNKFLLYTDGADKNSIPNKELYEALKQKGYIVKKAHEIYTIDRVTDEKILDLMKIKKFDPVFRTQRWSKLSDDTLLEYVESCLKWDYYKIDLNLDE
ncbi:MAG TPA: GntR family transcriptional regulator [Companilactobacillus farciminis]|uniref:GntR family transcriptional regulator n=1 Tax=Companilactobacillus farciminis TaxID=1612 RepID=A0A921HUM0_9LACO|nr:GntR family transcriptional regulator [Companilactobacillus farciminis]